MAAPLLENSLYHTIRYWSLFKRPVTAVELWRALVVVDPASPVRWQGHRMPTLQEIEHCLRTSIWLRSRVGTHWGYYFLLGHDQVEQYLRRHQLAQGKWKITRRVVRVLKWVPFVRGIFGSGSLAVMNTTSHSDLDLLVVAQRGRIWTTRLLLLVGAQLTGRRRRYWDRLAPDRICLNHYVADHSLVLPAEIHNVYTAMLYTHLLPLFGIDVHRQFVAANRWIKRLVMYPEALLLPPVMAMSSSSWFLFFRRFSERALGGRVGNVVERLAEIVQRRAVRRHMQPYRTGRIALSHQELAFHPDSKMEGLLAAYARDPGQRQLL